MLCGTHFEYTILTIVKSTERNAFAVVPNQWSILTHSRTRSKFPYPSFTNGQRLRKQVSIHVWFLFYATFISIHVPITNIFTTQGSYHIHTYMYVSIFWVHVIRHTQNNSYTFLILQDVMNESRTISFINEC